MICADNMSDSVFKINKNFKASHVHLHLFRTRLDARWRLSDNLFKVLQLLIDFSPQTLVYQLCKKDKSGIHGKGSLKLNSGSILIIHMGELSWLLLIKKKK